MTWGLFNDEGCVVSAGPPQDASKVGVVITYTRDGHSPPMPVRDQDGRVRVYEIGGRLVGWARLVDIEWTDQVG